MATNLPTLVNLTNNEKFVIKGPNTSIGRAPENDLIIPDDGYVSAHHARIYWDQGRWLIEDLNSSNGTTVNDTPVISPVALSPRDLIKFGRTNFRIE